MKRRLLCIAGILPLLVVAFYGLFSFPHLANGAFFFQVFEEFDSPDGAYRVVAFRRVRFPACEWVDPAAVLKLQVWNAAGQRAGIAQCNVPEISDCDNLEIIWGAGIPQFMVDGKPVPYRADKSSP